VQLASIRSYVERMRPPRALYCEFPLGRPLGKPNDAAYQRRVLRAALALLAQPTGPVLEDFPERIEDEAGAPLSCSLPPRYDPTLAPAVEEAQALRAPYERQRARSGRTNVGHAVDPDGIPGAVAAMLRIADGTPHAEAGLPGPPRAVALDIRAYYEEAAIALAEHTPHARQAESWFFRQTEAGAALRRARSALRAGGAEEAVWRFLIPSTQVD
jgi:hypothetical protein